MEKKKVTDADRQRETAARKRQKGKKTGLEWRDKNWERGRN